jgi:TolB-like protein/Tfp pilus assembly protein PilF
VKPADFLAELRRRNVLRAAAFYAASGWLLVQIATQVLPLFHIDEWVLRWIVVAAVFGFPFAMLFSWLYEWTPQGIKRETEIQAGASVTTQSGKRLDRWIIAVLGLAVVVLLANQFANRFVPRSGNAADTLQTQTAVAISTAAIPTKSIAVLPFTDLSAAHDQEYFSDGMAEELLNALAKVKDLKVAGRTSSFSFKGRNEDLRSIGKALGVANILEGSVRKQGEHVRITAQLIQTEDGYHLWSESYDGELTDIFDLQEKIARAITAQLRVILSDSHAQRLVPVATDNPQAYALYLQATVVFNRRDGAHFAGAIAALQEAIRLDPKFARAHSRLAALYSVATNYTAIKLDEADAAAEREARLAIELDPELAEPVAVQGRIASIERRWFEARKRLEQAVALDTADTSANFWLAIELIGTGYCTEGIAQLDRTLAIDPLLPNALDWRGTHYLFAGDRVSARHMLEQARDAGLAGSQRGLAFLAHEQGRDAEAIDNLSRGAEVFLVNFPAGAGRILAEGVFGDAAARARAVALVDTYLATRPKIISGGAPWALLLLGEPERALALTAVAPTSNDTLMMRWLWSPFGAAARRLPQFPEFVRKIGLAALWDRYGAPDDCHALAPLDYRCD